MHDRVVKPGAGVIPFAVVGGETFFLFQSVFSGRKAGHLIDFGGGIGDGESARECAMREFVEETETLYFASDLASARRTEASIRRQLPVLESLFDATLSAQPDWCCRRLSVDPRKPKDWTTFFVGVPYRDPTPMNLAWQNDRSGRFKKRRELNWVAADDLLSLYALDPQRLWKRVRQLDGAPGLIRRIRQTTRS